MPSQDDASIWNGSHGPTPAVKTAGKLQIEGKDYIVADGDIMHVRFNV